MFAGYTGEVLILFCCVFFSVLLFDVTAATGNEFLTVDRRLSIRPIVKVDNTRNNDFYLLSVIQYITSKGSIKHRIKRKRTCKKIKKV